ncbi:universal stress protein [Methylobacterium nigriterrae]|uniref:universal stress protein n=1 Tax=Methylobacterium nigriterrae TaxID=3127512 RepID=UPI003013BF69
MSFANILVSADPGSAARDRVRLAADLARRFGASLTGVAARAIRGPISVRDIQEAQAVYAKAEAEIAEELAQVRDTFERDAGEVETAWHSAATSPLALLVEKARAADLVVVGRRGPRDEDPGDMAVLPGPVLMEVGRPVLLVPPGVAAVQAARIVVAWKDTPETRRAVSGALPLITRAEQVFVATAGADGHGEGAEEVAGHLARHNARATTQLLPSPALSAIGEILRFAEAQKAGLLVMGGYGHSRLREWILGGATRDILQTTPICCLMSH